MLGHGQFSPGKSTAPLLAAALTLLLGAGLLYRPYWVFAWLVALLPPVLLSAGVWLVALGALADRRERGKRRRLLLAGLVLLASGGGLWFEPSWRDAVLWYCFAGWLFYTAFLTIRPALARGVERQVFWRWGGGLAALGLGILMLWKPRSGLSDALLLLGGFALAWGVFQLALPPHRD